MDDVPALELVKLAIYWRFQKKKSDSQGTLSEEKLEQMRQEQAAAGKLQPPVIGRAPVAQE